MPISAVISGSSTEGAGCDAFEDDCSEETDLAETLDFAVDAFFSFPLAVVDELAFGSFVAEDFLFFTSLLGLLLPRLV